MAKRSSLRASDADRDRVADRLRVAASEGRLLAHELEERLARALRALTYGELDDIVKDLPSPVETTRRGGRRGGGAFGLARRYPIPAGIAALLVATVTVAVIAVVALSGIWIIPLVLFVVLRGRGARRQRFSERSHLRYAQMHARSHRSPSPF